MRGLRVRKSAFTIQSFGLKRQLPLRDRIPSERAAGALSYDSELIAHTCKRVAPNRLAPVAPPFAFESSITPPPNRPELGDTERSNFDLTKQYESRPVLNHARYDATSQLTATDHSFQTDESYTYDANGNRTMTGYTTGTNNRLTNDGTHSYEHDDEGNRKTRTKTSTGEKTEYTWDHRNRLTRVIEKNSSGDIVKQTDYTYDVFDRRLSKSIDDDGAGSGAASVQRFVYYGHHIVMEFDGNNAGDLTHRYLHGPVIDQILADEEVTSLTQAGTMRWPLADNLGTVRDLVDSSASVLNHLKYDAYGKVTSESNAAVDFLFAFTGRERDEESGLQFNRARYYDPAVGRWISEDPIGFAAGDANLSRYVGNDTTNDVDPSGLLVPGMFGTLWISLQLTSYFAPPEADAWDYTSTPTGQDNYAAWFKDQWEWSWTPPDGWNGPPKYFWGNAYDFAYGFSDVATLGLAPLTRLIIGYDPGIDRSNPWYWGGAATPILIASAGAAALPSGIGAPVFGFGGTAGQMGSTTTIFGTRPLLGVKLPAAEANKLHHIFSNSQHNLGQLVTAYGGNQQAAYQAVQSAAATTAHQQGLAGIVQLAVEVKGLTVTVVGKMVDGVLRIGTFFIP
jgi:RHS repeat-associated protein